MVFMAVTLAALLLQSRVLRHLFPSLATLVRSGVWRYATPSSSGKVVRHRLNCEGDRRGNTALWLIAMTRLSCDERTRNYVRRRTAEGMSKREILRCLKRYIGRDESAVRSLDLCRTGK